MHVKDQAMENLCDLVVKSVAAAFVVIACEIRLERLRLKYNH